MINLFIRRIMRIAFVQTGQSFMPEVNAYIDYFSSKNVDCIVIPPGKLNNLKTDVEWFFMGVDYSPARKNVLRIHEYTSASTPPAAGLKDFVKRLTVTAPDYRVFLNDFVRKRLGFSDSVAFGFRDMGVPNSWLTSFQPMPVKEYDFIYIGDTSAQRKIDRLLRPFTKGDLQSKKIAIIGHRYEKLKQQFESYSNIFFNGPLTHEEVRQHILRSKYALNFIPDIAPFNQQTSTKFLEYAVNKTPVITSAYHWIRKFQRNYGGNYYYLNSDLSNLNWDAISNFEYSFPDMKEWTWEDQINRSGVIKFLQSKFPGILL